MIWVHIKNGILITLSDGLEHRFSLTENDQAIEYLESIGFNVDDYKEVTP